MEQGRDERDHLEWFGERAAIMQYDGGLPRLRAQWLAYWEWRRRHPGVEAPAEMVRVAMEYKQKVA